MDHWEEEERIRDGRHDGYKQGFEDPHGLHLGPSMPPHTDLFQEERIRKAYHDAYWLGVEEAERKDRDHSYMQGVLETERQTQQPLYYSPSSPQEIRGTMIMVWVALATIILLPLLICGLLLLALASLPSTGILGM